MQHIQNFNWSYGSALVLYRHSKFLCTVKCILHMDGEKFEKV